MNSKIGYTILLFLLFSGLKAQEPKLMLPFYPTMGFYSFFTYSPDGKYFALISGPVLFLYDAVSMKLLRYIKISNDFSTDGCFSPDGNLIIAAQANEATAWDPKTEKSVYTLKGHTGKIKTLSYSNDGKYILTASADSTAKIWNAKNGKLIYTLSHNSALESAVFSPDNNQILTSSNESLVRLWNCSTGQVEEIIRGQNGLISFASYSPDGSKILTNSTDSTIVIYSSKSGENIFKIKTHAEVRSVKYSPKGTYIYTLQADSGRVWLASSGQLILKSLLPRGSDRFLKKIVFSQNERYIFYGNPYQAKLADLEKNEYWVWGQSSYNYSAISVRPNSNDFIFGNGSGYFEIINADSLERIFANNQHASWISKLLFDTDSSRLISVHTTNEWRMNSLKVSDIQTNTVIYSFNSEDPALLSGNRGNKGKRILTYAADSKGVKVWDIITGKKILSLDTSRYVRNTSYSPDDKNILTFSWLSPIKIFSADSGHLIKLINGDKFTYADFSPGGDYIISTSTDSTVQFWNSFTGTLMKTFRYPAAISKFIITPEEKLMYALGDNEIIYVVNFENGIVVTELENSTAVESIKYSSSGKYLIAGFDDGTCTAWDVSGKILFRLVGHSGWVNSIALGKDGSIFTGSSDGTIKKWNGLTFECMATFSPIDSNDYYTYLPSKYYSGTQNATKLLHYVTKDLQVVTFEQLDIKYNRPDKVLEAIGNTDTSLIRSYRKAWEKRIKKLGIDTTAFKDGLSLPEADFKNRDVLNYKQDKSNIALKIRGNDSTYKIDRVNVWVNEIPIYGQRGISMRKQNINSFDSTITIELSQGENIIETSITNVNGTESYRMPLLVNYTPAIKQKEQTYFIGIGIDQFKDTKYNLKYSTKDIRDLSKKLKEKYKDIIIDTLFNEKVTVSNVKALKQILLQTKVNDKVIISYSGHGMLSKEFDYYLSTYPINFEKPEEKGLAYDELESLLDSIPARKKLMLIDACHSGEVDKDDLIAMNNIDTSTVKRGFKPVAYKNSGHLGLKNSFELMQSLFVNVGKGTGATIISAAAGTEFALEGVDNLPNGVFTYCILEAMNKNKTMKISELKKTVGERVVEITKGLQKPTSRNETIAVDWEVW